MAVRYECFLGMQQQLGRRAESQVEKRGDCRESGRVGRGAATLQVKAHEQRGLCLCSVVMRAIANASPTANGVLDGEEERK